MEFKVTGKIEKALVSGSDSTLYSVLEIKGDKQKKWAIWIPSLLSEGSTYELSGYISEYKDKKLKYEGGKDVWKTGFTAQSFEETIAF